MRNLHQQLNLVLHRFSLRLGFACFAALWKVKYTEASDSFHLDFFVCVHTKLHLMVFRSLTGCAVFKKSELDVISGHEKLILGIFGARMCHSFLWPVFVG